MSVRFELMTNQQNLELKLTSPRIDDVETLLVRVPYAMRRLIRDLESQDFFHQLSDEMETQLQAFTLMQMPASSLDRLLLTVAALSSTLSTCFGGTAASLDLNHGDDEVVLALTNAQPVERFSLLFATSFIHSLTVQKALETRFSQLLELARLYFLGDYSLTDPKDPEVESAFLPESLNSFVNFLHAEPWQINNLLTKILLVEDNPQLAEIFCDMLSSHGYVVAIASDGLEGLERCEHEQFDLILSDIQMPHLNGMGFLRMLRDLGRSTPMIMMTSYSTVWTREEVLRHGAFDLLIKPFTLEELLDCVYRTLIAQPGVFESPGK
jgi:CheY-like chemotaxis protein